MKASRRLEALRASVSSTRFRSMSRHRDRRNGAACERIRTTLVSRSSPMGRARRLTIDYCPLHNCVNTRSKNVLFGIVWGVTDRHPSGSSGGVVHRITVGFDQRFHIRVMVNGAVIKNNNVALPWERVQLWGLVMSIKIHR